MLPDTKTPNPASSQGTTIISAMLRIQDEYGYLNRSELERFSEESNVPLYRIQEIISFYPQFRFSRPAKVQVKVCRDMACHLAGSASLVQELLALSSQRIRVEEASCLGRCDRAPAVCIATGARTGQTTVIFEKAAREKRESEFYYLGRTSSDLRRIVRELADGGMSSDLNDEDWQQSRYPGKNWLIDPYRGKVKDYEAVRKLLAYRDERLRRAAETVVKQLKIPAARAANVLQSLRESKVDAGATQATEWVDTFFADLSAANLRGMGGAGVPAVQKWRDMREAMAQARLRKIGDKGFIVVNGDESEPGTFKDRELLLRYSHLVIEGVILAGLVTDATEGIIYIRHEYQEQVVACKAEIRRAESKGLCGANASLLGRSFPISVFVSPGGYICGEQGALVEALSDRRAEPRNLPPKLETNGLNDRPTLVSNVETFAWVPYIVVNGGNGYANLGANSWVGRRFFSVSGDVTRPGVYEVPMGLTLRELIHGDDYCLGVTGGKQLKGIAPSGPSGGILPAKLTPASLPRGYTTKKEWIDLAGRRGFDPQAEELDILDLELELNLFRALSPTQMLGAGIVVYAEGRDMVEQAVNATQFFRNESCGKCVPCRLGSQKLANLGANLLARQIEKTTWEKDLLPAVKQLDEAMNLTSICGLGRSVPIPLRTVISYFSQDVARYLR